jgi:hypothetical protein
LGKIADMQDAVGEPHGVFLLADNLGAWALGAHVDVNADDTLVRVFEVVVTIITKIQAGLLFVAGPIAAMALDTGRVVWQFAFHFDMAFRSRHM